MGWPPLRSYRMNSIKIRKMESEDNTGIYVKVGMDGAPYLRKVDLRVYKGYKELMEALNDMFKCFSLGKEEDILSVLVMRRYRERIDFDLCL